MTTGDFSRIVYDKRKHYSGVLMQQGKVLLDSDQIEGKNIHDEDLRRARVDIIGPYGSPDQGFHITEPNSITIESNSLIDFNIHPGTFYLGGIRLEFERNLIVSITIRDLDAVNDGNVVEILNNEINDDRFIFADPSLITKKKDREWLIINDVNGRAYFVSKGTDSLNIYEQETYRTQKNWLQQSNELPLLPDLSTNDERTDLVYLEVWQQPVSAVEDSELFEVALGGPDTAVRIRTMWRVMLEPGIASNDCAGAWRELKVRWKEEHKGLINEENERISDVRLSVSFAGDGSSDDLCKPSVDGGYLGAENQAIRVQLVDDTHLTWGFDNASPLYRVEVVDDNRTIVKLLTEPKDEAHWPIAGRIVEILPWSAVLPNSEKIAGISGYLSRVNSSYDPDTGELTLTEELSGEFGNEWESRSDADELEQPSKYFFMRVWNRGSDTDSAPEIEFVPGEASPLGNTGLQVTITGSDRVPGDYWIIAARPETPNKVVPWAFESGVGLPPHGIRCFFAPLALIRWTNNDQGEVAGEMLSDCRKTFPPLTQLQSCCTFMVGDGIRSHGDFDSIEEAVKNLPASGGEICLMLGIHEANVEIVGKHDIKIKGCGKKTMVIPGKLNRTEPVFSVIDSRCITLENMNIVTIGGTSIVLEGSEMGKLSEIEIHNNRIMACVKGISVSRGEGIAIHHNRIRMLDKENEGIAIFIMAEDSLIERNDISVIIPGNLPPITPPDGVTFPDPADPCANPEVIYDNTTFLLAYVELGWVFVNTPNLTDPFKALGGIQILGGSERVKVLENKITGGAGNGITLGGFLPTAISDEGEGDEDGVDNVIVHNGGTIFGTVSLEPSDSNALSEIILSFIDANENSRLVSINNYGSFKVENIQSGKYLVLTKPGFEINTINITHHEGRTQLEIIVSRKEINTDNVPAFLHDIQIDRNEISYMGLSGIGTPVSAIHMRTDVLNARIINPQIVNVIFQLSISENHIFHCLQNSFDTEAMRGMVMEIGFGGISIGICINLFIHRNRIQNNGTSHYNPSCGIFVAHGDHVSVIHNLISNNGPYRPGHVTFNNGVRGGIFLKQVTSLSPFEMYDNLDVTLLSSKPAARVHDNIVEQPAGPSLTIKAIGSVSVVNNQFNSELSGGPDKDYLQAGAVSIKNMGIFNDLKSKGNGNVLFNNNQVRVGSSNKSNHSVSIESEDDIGFEGNQSDNHKGRDLHSNTFLSGNSIRAIGNRFKEFTLPRDTVLMSLYTRASVMNITMNNQGDHCIIAKCATTKLSNDYNQVLVADERCNNLGERPVINNVNRHVTFRRDQ